jgi:hypothetical protein
MPDTVCGGEEIGSGQIEGSVNMAANRMSIFPSIKSVLGNRNCSVGYFSDVRPIRPD